MHHLDARVWIMRLVDDLAAGWGVKLIDRLGNTEHVFRHSWRLLRSGEGDDNETH
jgi:hypothetical protein